MTTNMTDDEQAAQIDDMCDRWATIPGSFESREQFRLTTGENIDVFVTLGFASMRAAARGLAKTGFGTSTAMPDRDHLYFWAWTGEVFFGKRSPFLGRDNKFDIEIKELAQDVLTIALVIDAPAYVTIEPSQSLKPQLIHDMLMHSFGRLPYLAFPLLEGLVKRSCKDYIKPNGEVRKKWKARGQEIQAGEAGRRTPLL